MSEITRLPGAAGGDMDAAQLLPLVYDELRRLARARLADERAGHTLQATALVHEAYLRLVGGGPWDGRRHFYGAAAEAMRRILVEHARRRDSLKRGGGRQRVALADEQHPPIASPCDDIDILALDEALGRLAAEDPHRADLVKLLYFAGLTLDEAAAALELSKTTAHRQWIYARAWLFDAMSGT